MSSLQEKTVTKIKIMLDIFNCHITVEIFTIFK